MMSVTSPTAAARVVGRVMATTGTTTTVTNAYLRHSSISNANLGILSTIASWRNTVATRPTTVIVRGMWVDGRDKKAYNDLERLEMHDNILPVRYNADTVT